jgi:hypothetical protein
MFAQVVIQNPSRIPNGAYRLIGGRRTAISKLIICYLTGNEVPKKLSSAISGVSINHPSIPSDNTNHVHSGAMSQWLLWDRSGH